MVWYILAWYIPPLIAIFALHWWETDILCGDEWDRRCDIRWVASCIVASALWPLFGFFLCKRTYVLFKHIKFARQIHVSRNMWMAKCLASMPADSDPADQAAKPALK